MDNLVRPRQSSAVYVLVVIVKKQMKFELSLYTILQIFSLTLFEKKHILRVLSGTEYRNKITISHMQLKLL